MSVATEEQWVQLQEPFPASAIMQKPKKNKDGQTTWLDYVGHAEVTERLNNVDPTWTFDFIALDDDGGPLIRERESTLELWINLTILGVTRPGVGTVDKGAWSGEVSKELISDALRNAAMRFGVALDLWKRHITSPAVTDSQPAPGATVRDAVSNRAKGVPQDSSGPLTTGQSRNLYRLWHHVLKMDKAEYLEAILIACGREIEDDRELSSRDAGRVITYLKEQAGEEDSAPPAREETPPPLDDSTFEFGAEPF